MKITLLGLFNILVGFMGASTFVVEFTQLKLYHHLVFLQLVGVLFCVTVSVVSTLLLWRKDTNLNDSINAAYKKGHEDRVKMIFHQTYEERNDIR